MWRICGDDWHVEVFAKEFAGRAFCFVLWMGYSCLSIGFLIQLYTLRQYRGLDEYKSARVMFQA